MKIKINILMIICLAINFVGLNMIALADNPEKAKEHFNGGLTLEKEGKDDLAIIEYKQATIEDPTFIDAFINLGSIYFRTNNIEDAIKQFKKVTELDATNADGWANLGRAYYKKGDNLEAETAYKKALEANKEYYEIYKDLGYLYHKQKNWPALVESMTSFTGHVSDDNLAYYMLGKAQQKLKKYPEAIAALNKAAAIDDNYFNTFNTLAQVYQAQENHDKAFEMYNKAVQIKADNYLALYNRAIEYQTINAENDAKIDQVINYWQKFVNVAKNNPRATGLVSNGEQVIDGLKERKAVLEANKKSES